MLKRTFVSLFLVVIVLPFTSLNIFGDNNGDADLTRELMDVSGLEKSVQLLPQLIKYQLLESDMVKLPIDKNDVIKVINESIDITAILEGYYNALQSALLPDEKKSLIEWYSTDLGKRIIDLELNALDKEEMKKRDEFAQDIRNLQVSPARSELLQKYDDTIKLTEEVAEFASNAKQKLTQKSITGSEKRKISNETYIKILFTYKDLSDEDLGVYINFLATEAGQKITRLTREYEKTTSMDLMRKIQEGIKNAMYADSGEYVFKEYNFKFNAPGKPWIKLDVSAINPNATLFLQKSGTGINMMIIAEKLDSPKEFTEKTLIEISKSNFKNKSEKIKFYGEKKYKVNGINGVKVSMDATIKKLEVYTTVWGCSRNGYLFQIIITGPKKSKRAVNKDFKELIKGFNLIEKDKKSYADSIKYLDNFSSKYFGYELKLKRKEWLLWDDLDKDIPEAEIGGYRNAAYFSIFPVYLGENRPDIKAILSALPRFMNIEDDDSDITNLKPFNDDGLEGYTFDFRREYERNTLLYKFKIIVKSPFAYMAGIWAPDKFKDLELYSKELFDSISFNDVNGNEFDKDSLDARIKEAQAEFNNSMGSTTIRETSLTLL